MQTTKNVKHSRTINRPTAAGIAVLAIGLLSFAVALVMKLAGMPAWWRVLAVTGGLASLGLAGLSLIAGLLIERQLADNEDHVEALTNDP